MNSSTASPIPIKQRPRSSFSQHQQALRKRRPSDVDRDRTTSSRLAALSLSPPGINTQNQTTVSKSVPLDDPAAGATGSGKKKGAIFKCETCAKAYRHPSCLVKHRWEHSPHWREASKFLLSKHQQVQLLEAAAILSHLSPTKSGGGTSLPEDRSLWPSYLSGGLLPMPTTNVRPPTTTKPLPPRTNTNNHAIPNTQANTNHDDNSSMSTSDDDSEPETHNGSVASPYGGGSKPLPTPIPALTQFRPGLLGHPNPPTPASSLPTQPSATGAMAIPGSSAGGSSPWGHVVTSAPAQAIYGSLGAGVGAYYGQSPFSFGSGPNNVFGSSSAGGPGFSSDSEAEAGGRGWSLPRSSVRSGGEESKEEVDILGDADMNASKGKNVEEKDKSNTHDGDWDMEMDM